MEGCRGKIRAYGEWWGGVRDGLSDLLRLQKSGVRVDALESTPDLCPDGVRVVNAAFLVLDGSGGFLHSEVEAMLRLYRVPAALWPRYAHLIAVFSRAASAAIARHAERAAKGR